MVQRDRDGVVRPQRHFGAVVGVGQKQPPPQLLAGKIDEDARLVKDRRLDEDVAGVGEEGAERRVEVAHRAKLRRMKAAAGTA